MDSTTTLLPTTDLARGEYDATRFLNRELGWLEFNKRVLQEALDSRTPLLERLRFLTIFTANLDEFFMKRVGGLNRQIAAGISSRTVDGMSPQEQLFSIREKIIPMLQTQAHCFREEILPSLAKHGVFLLRWADLSSAEKEFARNYFRRNVFPTLTPLAVDPGHPFPYISNLSTSLAALIQHPERDEELFAQVKIPKMLPQWIRLASGVADGGFRFIALQDLIRQHLPDLFPQMIIRDAMVFRLTRNADIERDEEDAEDLLEMIEEEVRQRRFAKVVRLEYGSQPAPALLRYLVEELEVREDDTYHFEDDFDYATLQPIIDLNLPQLRYAPWVPVVPAVLADEAANIFSVIRGQDLLVHHPYDSFPSTVERFVRTAVEDPRVITIKMTVYRTGDQSPFMPLLIRAAQEGKQVVCLVELKARFEEERNIYWAQALEEAGVNVVYGLVGLKTHAKTILVVREESDGIRLYAHIGTGNYHPQTAMVYGDMGIFTSRPEVTEELVQVFHYLTGRSLKRDYKTLYVAPINLKDRLLEHIDREIEHKKAGRPARILFKMNAFEDPTLINALYRASQAGVAIDLLVRGFCCLRPQFPGLSENIRVLSLIGRFLEHSRFYYFRNGQPEENDGTLLIGSADLMSRNLQNRVEVIVPVEDRGCRKKCWESIAVMLQDQRSTWEMNSDGTYCQRQPSGDPTCPTAHQLLMNQARQSSLSTPLSPPTNGQPAEVAHDRPKARPKRAFPSSRRKLAD